MKLPSLKKKKKEKKPLNVSALPLNVPVFPKDSGEMITLNVLSREIKEHLITRFKWVFDQITYSIEKMQELSKKATAAKRPDVADKADELKKMVEKFWFVVNQQELEWIDSHAWNGIRSSTVPNWPVYPLTRRKLSQQNLNALQLKFNPVTWNRNASKTVFAPNVMKFMDSVGRTYLDLITSLKSDSRWAKTKYADLTTSVQGGGRFPFFWRPTQVSRKNQARKYVNFLNRNINKRRELYYSKSLTIPRRNQPTTGQLGNKNNEIKNLRQKTKNAYDFLQGLEKVTTNRNEYGRLVMNNGRKIANDLRQSMSKVSPTSKDYLDAGTALYNINSLVSWLSELS